MQHTSKAEHSGDLQGTWMLLTCARGEVAGVCAGVGVGVGVSVGVGVCVDMDVGVRVREYIHT